MKVGLTISTVSHAALLGFGLLTLSAPSPLEVGDVEAFPVDIVPIGEMSQMQQGEREAPVAERAAPVPTSRPDHVPDAANVGDNTVDLQNAPTPEPSPREVEVAAAPPPQPEPAPEPAPQPEPEPEPAPAAEPEPVPATEVTPEPQARQEVTPEPTEQPAIAEAPAEEAIRLPPTAPIPQARPQPPQARTARAPERRDSERPTPPRQTPAQSRSQESDFNADEIAALLDRRQPSGGGAQRSTEQAALGGRRTTSGSTLTQSEMDALRGQIQRCWNIPAGAMEAENLRVSVQFKLDRAGGLEGRPEIVAGGGGGGVERAAAESARRAILQCAPYNLPADKYDAWADVIVHFDPRDMF